MNQFMGVQSRALNKPVDLMPSVCVCVCGQPSVHVAVSIVQLPKESRSYRLTAAPFRLALALEL